VTLSELILATVPKHSYMFSTVLLHHNVKPSSFSVHMSGNFNWSPEWQAKLSRVTELAEHGKEGDEFFLEMSHSNPMCSMYLRTGGVSENNPNKKDVHLVVEQEPRTYPYWPSTQEEMKEKAYGEYLKRFGTKNTNSSCVPMSKSIFKDRFTNVAAAIDSAIREHHGIMCYHDGNTQHHHISNTYVLHICDVLNIHMRKKKGLGTQVLIRSNFLRFIGPETKSKFLDEQLSEYQLSFLEENVDYYYRVYGYYNNDSKVPVWTWVDRSCEIFTSSRFFMNDTFYTKHQKGKLKEFNLLNTSIDMRVFYRSL
jgi:hypothetical protein